MARGVGATVKPGRAVAISGRDGVESEKILATAPDRAAVLRARRIARASESGWPKGAARLAVVLRLQRGAVAGGPLAVSEFPELLGHQSVKTTMIYTHVLNRGGRGDRRPGAHLGSAV